MLLLTNAQKRKRREYRVQRNAAFTRPDPGFSLYEGRTRGKRLRYTFSDEEDFDSDNLGARRSARTSGRDTPAAPSGPTVTASGRQVRSRATGLYGETLLSGQVSDRASPATGDYVRSDASEEPQQSRGRATRAANRGAANGRPSNRALDSEDEDDATSWDGGDEDEDEPEQMDLDDDEEPDAESSEEDEEPHTLMVTLRYGKGQNPQRNDANKDGPIVPAAIPQKQTSTNGKHNDLAVAKPEVVVETKQHIPAPIEPPLQPAPLPPQPITALPQAQPLSPTYLPNGHAMFTPQAAPVPVLPAAQPPQPIGNNPTVLPRLEGMFSAQQPQQPLHPQQQNQFPHGQPAQQPQQPFVQQPIVQQPPPTSTWQ